MNVFEIRNNPYFYYKLLVILNSTSGMFLKYRLFRVITFILPFLFVALNAGAEDVLTRAGTRVSGKMLCRDGKIFIITENQETNEFGLNEILDIVFQKPGTTSTPARVVFPFLDFKIYGGSLPQGWKSQDIGSSRNRGVTVWQPENNNLSGVFTLRSSGTGPGTVSDSLHFVYTRAGENGAAVVRISGRSALDKRGCAGLMLRNTAETRSAFVSIGVNNQGVPILEWRDKDGGNLHSVVFTNRGEFQWVKLRWHGQKIIAGFSNDGVSWENADPVSVNLIFPVSTGYFLYSGNEKYTAQSRFTDASILEFPNKSITDLKEREKKSRKKIVVLRNGSLIVGELEYIGDGLAKFRFLDKEYSLSIEEIGSFQFIQFPYEWQIDANAGRRGIFLINGKFVEADGFKTENDTLIAQIQGKISRFKIDTDIAGIQFSPINYRSSSFEVKLTNDSVIFAEEGKIFEDGIILGVKGFGDIEIKWTDLVQFRRIGNLENLLTYTANAGKKGTVEIEVETIRGERFSGLLNIVNNEPMIETADGKNVRLRTELIKRLKIKLHALDSMEKADLSGKIRQFSGIDLRPKPTRGRNYVENGVLYVEDYPPTQNLQNAEPTYFLCYPIEGDFELVAEVSKPEALPRGNFAGLLVQDNVGHNANGIFCGTDSKSIIVVRKYSDRQGSISKHDFRSPIKIKIERIRRRLTITSTSSREGSNWTSITSIERELPAVVYAGFAVVNTNRDGKSFVATFKNIEMRKKQLYDYPAKLVLVDGSCLNCEILSCSESALTVGMVLNPRLSIPVNQIAFISFDGKVEESDYQCVRKGLLLKNNDFFECEFRGIEGDSIVVSSTIFGIRYFRIGDPVKRVFLRKTSGNQIQGYEVVLKDTSSIVAEKFSIKSGHFVFSDLDSGIEFEAPVQLVEEVRKK